MSRLKRGVVPAVLFAFVMVGGQGVAAFGAPSSTPGPAQSPAPSRSQSIQVEQSRADVARPAGGRGSGEKLIVKDVITDRDGTTNVRYDRTFDGLRVIGGDLVSHRDKSGKVRGVTWNSAHQISVPSTVPKISLASAEAVGAAKAASVQKATTASTGELVVYAGASAKATPMLAFDVVSTGVRADQTPSKLHTVVDATKGTVLTSWDEVETGTGNGILVGSVPLGTTAGPPFSLRDPAGNVTTDLFGATAGTGSTFTDTDDIWGNGTVTDRASAGVDAHYGAEKTFDFYKNVLGRNGIWNTGGGARSRVHYSTNYVNAFWDGTQMTYGDGASNTHPLTELDVAGHEMTHGVTENTANLFYGGESGGLNEATSDIFGTAVEWYANNLSDTPDYLIGEKIDINGNGTPLRYMDQPSKDTKSPDCWSPTLGQLDVHYSSGPLNHWFYLASEGSGAKVINGVSYNSPTCNGSTVTPIGRDAAERIWYRALTTYLTSSSNYAAARLAAIKSAKDLYGGTSAQCAGIQSSFSAIGVPVDPTVETCTTAAPPPPPPPPPGSNLLVNPGFESGNTLWASTAGVIGSFAGQPAHTGTWDAWLDGYGTTHTDSITQSVTIPTASSATLSYYVHIDTQEATGDPVFDTLTVRAGSTVLQTLSNQNAAPGYQLKTVDLSAFVGKTVSLSFTGVEDSSLATSFVVDDLTVVTPPTSSTLPGAPTGVTATAGNQSAVVSWTAPASNGGSAITKYTVTSTPGGQTSTSTGTNPPTTATVSGLTNGTSYTFTVTATNATGTSGASSASAPVTPSSTPTVPGAPTGVTATPGNASATVSWTPPISNGGSTITSYTVTASGTGGQKATTGPSPTPPTTATVAGLTNGTAYTFTVTATNATGTSNPSGASSSVTPSGATAPSAPTGVTAVPNTTYVTVRWTAPTSNGGSAITGYLVRVAITATNAQVGALRPAGASATSLFATPLTNGISYTFTVTATNAAGTSLPSSPVSATPIGASNAPTNVKATTGTVSGTAVVSWTPPTYTGGTPLTGYSVIVEIAATGSQVGAQLSAGASANSLVVTGLKAGTTYDFLVQANNVTGGSSYGVSPPFLSQ